ncbi:hypothetical protein D1818_22080 [Aquimarina sp. BL5]|uniref:DUF6503 family protein n=1 Tax=Aquimarina sp. BL5 TaxID=1714860 RepID=UPI000E48E7A7|nr:DUF6503 family protein [Aquimarina sp. BL5]AXT53383.1 hypothetical protein D1818_22080 [Aquimarina sp. BL5]RKN00496.1 hypothetical protein D7036_18645 [Aquimarina sp. BL5]
MKKVIFKIVPFVLIVFAFSTQAQEAKELIAKVVEANGGKNALHKLKDVSFDYTFKVKDNNVEDVSKERYIFDREVSFAEYTKRQVYAIPQMPGETYTQFFNGTNSISKIDGKAITEQQPAFIGHILRKTNYYWFTMMFKLSDPGVNHKILSSRKVEDITYKVIEMTFGDNIGESSQDKYILYINPQTYRVDQFLYNATGFGITEPSIMKVKYEKVDGIYLSTYRRYAPADWDGNKLEGSWTEQFTKNVKFNNGYNLENIQS